MNYKYIKSTVIIFLVLCGILFSSEKGFADERDTFDVLMTSEEKAEVEDIIERSKTMSAEAQGKLQEALDSWGKLQDHFEKYPLELQDLINKVNAAGLKTKIITVQGKLKKFDSGLQSIMDKKEKVDQVIGFYDRYRPDADNPFRSLEVLENLLTDIESFALPEEQEYEALKNTPVFLIRTAIRYFKEGIQSAQGGLKNIQKQIKDRAGNCIGYVGGDAYGDPNDPKRKTFEELNTGDIICYTGVRPIGGEVWKNTSGDGVYVWSSDSWTKLDCGFGIANKVFDYWKLAHESAISSYDLIYWCTGNWTDVFTKAHTKGETQLKKLTSVDQCQQKILGILNLDNDFEELMESDGSNIDLFMAKYIFEKDRVRELADLIANVISETILFEGIVKDNDGNRVSNANVRIEINSDQVSIDTKSNGSFEILAEVTDGRYTGLPIKIKITATKYPDFQETSRIHSQCMDLGVLSIKGSGQLIIKPIISKIEQGESVDFVVMYTDPSGDVLDVTSVALKNAKFNAETVGVFTILAKYDDLSAKASVEVIKHDCKENEEWSIDKKACVCKEGFTPNKNGDCIKVKECKENEHEHWDADIGDCICDDGYSKNKENVCVSDEEESTDDCSIEYIKSLVFLLEVLVADTKLSETELLSYINKFNKEINDQSSNPCDNSIIAYCYYSASEIAARMAENVTDIHDIAVEIIMLQAMCPDLNQQMQTEGITVKSLISSISGLGAYKDKISQMESRLRENGCDEEEVHEEGEKIVPPEGDSGFIQDGGTSTEMPGDGDDNDGDGQQDEEIQGLTGYNVTLVLYDSGSAKDDVFNLFVQGYGNLGQTPAGGLRSYGLNLPPGTYTAIVKVIIAPDNVGTYTLTALYKGESIGTISGSPPQGSSATLIFTVPSE